MNGWSALDRFLRTDPRDAGCDEAMAVLHISVDLVAAGQDVAGCYPGDAAHLSACTGRRRRPWRPAPASRQPHLLPAGTLRRGQPAAIGIPHGSGIPSTPTRHQSP